MHGRASGNITAGETVNTTGRRARVASVHTSKNIGRNYSQFSAFGGNYSFLVWDENDKDRRAICVDPADPITPCCAPQTTSARRAPTSSSSPRGTLTTFLTSGPRRPGAEASSLA